MRMDVTFVHDAINLYFLHDFHPSSIATLFLGPPSALHQNCIYFQLSPIIVDSHELALRYFSKLRA